MRLAIRTHGPVLAAVAVATAWAALALSSPSRTYHVAPGFVAAAWPATARILRGRTTLPTAARAALGGFVAAALTTLELDRLDSLRGPALIGGSALAESLIAAAAAALWGAWALARARPGVILGSLDARE